MYSKGENKHFRVIAGLNIVVTKNPILIFNFFKMLILFFYFCFAWHTKYELLPLSNWPRTHVVLE